MLHSSIWNKEIGDRNETWPKPYLTGRDQLWRLADREAEQDKGK